MVDRQRIGLDCDGVLYKFSHAAQYMFAKREGLDDREDLQPWDDTRWDCGRPKEDWDWVLSAPQADKVFRHGHLFGGAIEFVEELDKIGDVYIITKRPKPAVKATLDFFSYHGFPIAGLYIVGLDEPKSKIDVDLWIDDSTSNMDELSANTPRHKPLILLSRPWNAGYENPDVWRADSYEEVLTLVDTAARGSGGRR